MAKEPTPPPTRQTAVTDLQKGVSQKPAGIIKPPPPPPPPPPPETTR